MTRERISFSTRRFLVGKAGPFLRLVFHEDVMLRLDQFSYLHSRGEHGGFLIGRKRELKSAEEYEVIVERFVPIPQKDDASRLVISQEHLQTVHRALQEADNGEEIVGWAHTHPGFGVFLSNFDKEQHTRFFPQQWQIAYVMDNQAQERAAYHSVDGEWNRLEGYYVLREMAENEIGIKAGQIKMWSRLGVLALLLVLLVGAGSYGYSWLRQRNTVVPVQDKVVQQASDPTPQLLPVVSVEHKNNPPQSTKIKDETPQPSAQPVPTPLYGEYIVQDGDTLWKIAQKLWGDPSLFPLLAEENKIKNPSVIPVGKVLLVPQRPK